MSDIYLISVTYHNYGSLLQTFALQDAITKLGYKTEILQYSEQGISKIRRLKDKEYTKTRFKMILKKLILSFLYPGKKHDLIERKHSFDNFIKEELLLSSLITSLNSIKEESKGWKTVLLGSDQVWHPINLYMDYFTLNFVPDNVKKIAYAPSFGVSEIPSKYKTSYEKYINRFQHLSCREQKGVEIIKELTGRKAQLVCDPTLLLTRDEWEAKMSEKVKFEVPYIFCYLMGNNPNHRKLISEYKTKYKIKIVALTHIDEYIPSDEGFADYTPYNVGPKEFLYLIKNAQAVMTDSFHATVFSLIFQKSFYTFNRFENNSNSSTTSRIDSLLNKVGLIDRKMPHNATMQDIIEKTEIDYKTVSYKIDVFRNESIEYLKSSLKHE